METTGSNRKRRTRQDVQTLLGRYQASGKSARAFCKEEGVAESSLYKWLRREQPGESSPELVEVKVPAPNLNGGLRIATPRGYQVEVPETSEGERDVTDSPYTMVSIEEFQTMMATKDFYLVNVHIPVEGNIPGTDANIPFDEIPAYLDRFPQDKDSKIVLYCKSNSMALSAAEELSGFGYTNLYNVDGGTVAWQEAGLELEQ